MLFTPKGTATVLVEALRLDEDQGVASQQDFFSSSPFLFGCGSLALCNLDMAFGRVTHAVNVHARRHCDALAQSQRRVWEKVDVCNSDRRQLASWRVQKG